MISDPVPFWWVDIRRSGERALEGIESVLDQVETGLAADSDRSPATLRDFLDRWSALSAAAGEAASSLASFRRLHDARVQDVRRSGFEVPGNFDFVRRTESVSVRISRVSEAIRHGIRQIEAELSVRQRSRSVRRQRSLTPVHIDLHV